MVAVNWVGWPSWVGLSLTAVNPLMGMTGGAVTTTVVLMALLLTGLAAVTHAV